MGLITRPTKQNGTTSHQDGDDILATEVNGDIDPVYNAINGQLDDENIKAGAGIGLSKLDDASSTDAASRASATPGNSGAPNKASSIEGEIQRLRYRVQSQGVGISALRNDGTASADEASWQDSPRVGPNLARNASFEAYNGAANSAPDGWTLVGTPTTVAQVETDVDLGEGKAIRVVHTGGGSDEGLSQTFAGLKASARYLIGCAVEVTSGTFHLKTTGASGSVYGNLDLTSTASDFAVVSGIVLTDSTPTDIVVQIVSEGGAADDFRCDHFFFYELGDDPAVACKSTRATTSGSDADSNRITSAGWADIRFDATNTAELAVTVPGPGYVVSVSAAVQVLAGGSGTMTLRLNENDGSTDTVVDHSTISPTAAGYIMFHFDYELDPAVPGTTYTYHLEGRSNSPNGTVNGNSSLPTGAAARSWLRVELKHVG